MTFTKAENILAASVSSLLDYQSKSRVVSGVGTNNNGSIHRDGKIFTGYYKNWRMKHMFNYFEEENYPMTEAAKLRFLLDKKNHPQLESDVSALRVKNNLASG